ELTRRSAFVRRGEADVLALLGDDGAEFLQGQVTNDVERLAEGEGCYAALLTPKGKIRGDMRVLRTPDALVVVTEPASLQAVRHTIETYRIGFLFKLEDRSSDSQLVSLIGPDARAALAAIAAGSPTPGGTEHDNAVVALEGGSSALAITTDLGVDLVLP